MYSDEELEFSPPGETFDLRGLSQALIGYHPDRAQELEREIGYTELVKAIDAHDLRWIRELAEAGVDLNTRDIMAQTPLHRAVDYNSIEMAALLLAHGANPNVHDILGQTPLHRAVMKNNPEMVNFLLDWGARFKVISSDWGAVPGAGSTPLHLAVRHNDLEIVELLLARGADPNARDMGAEHRSSMLLS